MKRKSFLFFYRKNKKSQPFWVATNANSSNAADPKNIFCKLKKAFQYGTPFNKFIIEAYLAATFAFLANLLLRLAALFL